MIYTENLEQIILKRHLENNADHLIVISGYVGPGPIKKLSQLPLTSTVIYGMYGSCSVSFTLHNTLMELDKKNTNLDIRYSTIPVHSKCYIWIKDDIIIDALIGSANFSANGLNTPFRETLSHINKDSYSELQDYLGLVVSSSIACFDGIPSDRSVSYQTSLADNNQPTHISQLSNVCNMTLLDREGYVPVASGLNWFNSPNGHTTPSGDAYIPIRADYIRNYPNLFPKKQSFPKNQHSGRQQRENDYIDVIWDDGTIMECLLEGSQSVANLKGKYPKNFASSPKKSILGLYIRERLGVSPNHIITRDDLVNYGRTDIELSVLADGSYYANFSVKKSNNLNFKNKKHGL